MAMEKEVKLRVKEILSEKDMTLKELAEKMGKFPQYISNVVNGKKGVSVSSLMEIADALDVEIGDLFARKKDDGEKPIEVASVCPHCGKLIKIRIEKL